ncbi:unnamed protein product, partial [Ectocarpus sp. 13 AM-2016]
MVVAAPVVVVVVVVVVVPWVGTVALALAGVLLRLRQAAGMGAVVLEMVVAAAMVSVATNEDPIVLALAAAQMEPEHGAGMGAVMSVVVVTLATMAAAVELLGMASWRERARDLPFLASRICRRCCSRKLPGLLLSRNTRRSLARGFLRGQASTAGAGPARSSTWPPWWASSGRGPKNVGETPEAWGTSMMRQPP